MYQVERETLSWLFVVFCLAQVTTYSRFFMSGRSKLKMIEKMRSMAVFAAVVEEGSFRAAGEKLGLSASVVSQHVTTLQERLGQVLLVRYARKLTLTEEGKVLFQAAREMVRSAEFGLNALAKAENGSTGKLNICMPIFLSGGIVQDIVEDFLLANPKVSIELDFRKKPLHPLEDDCDLSVTTGVFQESLLSSREIVGSGASFYAAPDLAQRIAQMHLADIPVRIPILLGADYSPADWAGIFLDGRPGIKSNLTFRLICDDIGLIHRLCRSGAGLAILPRSRVVGDVASGRLVQVLQDVALKQLEFRGYWRTRCAKAPLIEAFLDHMNESLERMRV